MSANYFFKITTNYIVNFKLSTVADNLKLGKKIIDGGEYTKLFKQINKPTLKEDRGLRKNKPSLFDLPSKIKNLKIRRRKIVIMYRNLLLFFFLCKVAIKHEEASLKVGVFIKPYFIKHITFLRAPYRYKLGKYQVSLTRYLISVSFMTKPPSVSLPIKEGRLFDSMEMAEQFDVVAFFHIIRTNFQKFETNICYIHQHRLIYHKDYGDEFSLN